MSAGMFSINWCRTVEGWLAACVTATAVICAYPMIYSMFLAVMVDGNYFGTVVVMVFFTLILVIPASAVVFTSVCLLTPVPAAAAIWLSERFRIRSLLFFTSAGAAIGGLIGIVFITVMLSRPPSSDPLFVLAGLAAGAAYWLVAGRHAGQQSAGPA